MPRNAGPIASTPAARSASLAAQALPYDACGCARAELSSMALAVRLDLVPFHGLRPDFLITVQTRTMQQIPKVVLAELRSAWRYRWHALAVAWAVCLLGWLVVYLTPDVYEARARFYLDTTSALQPFVKELSVGMDVDQQIDLVRKVVLGREALLSVASETDLSKQATTPAELEVIARELRDSIQLTGGGCRDHGRSGSKLPDRIPRHGSRPRSQGRTDRTGQLHRKYLDEAQLWIPVGPGLPAEADRAAGAAPGGGREQSWPTSSAATSTTCPPRKEATSGACRPRWPSCRG